MKSDLTFNTQAGKSRFAVIAGLIVIAAFTRLIPHPANFTAVMAIALFGGVKFRKSSLAILVPLSVMFVTDLIIGFHSLMPLVYGCIAVTAMIGIALSRKPKMSYIIGGSLFSSVLFFLVTNAGVWFHNPLYSQDMNGLFACYNLALPFFNNEFFRNQVLGDLFFNGALFGSFALVSKRLALANA